MWLFVLFDLPTKTKKQRKNAHQFRMRLLSRGFIMMQYSVYIRHCGTTPYTDTVERFVIGCLPPEGTISIIRLKDKQFGRIKTFTQAEKREIKAPQRKQLTLF